MNKRWHKYTRFDLMMEEKKKNVKPTKLLLISFSIKNNKNKRQKCSDSFRNKTYATNNVVYGIKNFIGDIKEYYYKALLLFGEKLSNKNRLLMKLFLKKLFNKFNLKE